jgi:hypothetical protein
MGGSHLHRWQDFTTFAEIERMKGHASEAWAAKLRARYIGDIRRWKDRDGYKKSFARLARS